MDHHQIAGVLAEIAAILEIKGENPFKIRAYENAARVVEGLSNLPELIQEEKLTTIKGIGKNLADHITELYKTGRLKEHKELVKSVPTGLLEILQIPGVGAKKVKFFWEKLRVTNISELESICQRGRLRSLPGFGEKSEEKILQGIVYLKKHRGQYLYPYALEAARALESTLKKNKNVARIEIAGSLRRKKEIIKDIDLLVSTNVPGTVMKIFTGLPDVTQVIASGATKSSVLLKSGIQADLRCVTDREFPYALHHFTGSKEHNTVMRARAKKMGLKMNEYGLFKGGQNIPCKSEEDIFKALGLSYIPPELREDRDEITAAEKGALPDLIEEGDIRGLLHVHTKYSDGTATIEEMVLAAKKRGYQYIAVCDHSQTPVYANGMKIETVKKQHKEIDTLNKKIDGIKILKGIEVDILKDGSLDYPDSVMETFDFVVASVHSRFSMTEEEMTERICTALAHPAVNVLGHLTGRLLLARESYPLDVKHVIDTAAEYHKVIELNASPQRFDIDWRYGQYLKEKGVKIAINPDAHSVAGIDAVQYGVGIARKAWMTKEDVINTWPLEKFEKWLKR